MKTEEWGGGDCIFVSYEEISGKDDMRIEGM